MAYCTTCSKTFKNPKSLASHRYTYHKPTHNNVVEDKPSTSAVPVRSEEKRVKINIANAAFYPKLIKMLCKCVLHGQIPMTKEQKKVLKSQRKIIRQIAKARVAQGQKLIRQQVRKHNETGDSIIEKLMEFTASTIDTLFYLK